MPDIPLPPRNADGSYTTSPAGMAIDADGANGQTGGVPVYAPEGYTPAPLDFLANAGKTGDWFGVVTDTNQANGNPIKQGASGPAPGAFVSATSYRWPTLSRIDPLAYVDAASLPHPFALHSKAAEPLLRDSARMVGSELVLNHCFGRTGPSIAFDKKSGNKIRAD